YFLLRRHRRPGPQRRLRAPNYRELQGIFTEFGGEKKQAERYQGVSVGDRAGAGNLRHRGWGLTSFDFRPPTRAAGGPRWNGSRRFELVYCNEYSLCYIGVMDN